MHPLLQNGGQFPLAVLARENVSNRESGSPKGAFSFRRVQHRTSPRPSILENFIDQTGRRNWFLFEISRNLDDSGH